MHNDISTLLRVGIDVGGTNSDAVVMRGRTVLHGLKTPTTGDVTTGVVNAIRQVLAGADVAPGQVDAVMIGTTQFTNALVERRRLAPVGLIRLALPGTRGVPPLSGWPADMQAALPLTWRLAHGGGEFDGLARSELQRDELRALAAEFAAAGIAHVAISAPFSFMDDRQEQQAAAWVQEVLPTARITLSSQIGGIDLLARENAAVLNASLGPLGQEVVGAFESALQAGGITAPFFLTQNDGTLMGAAIAARFPILTVSSGPTNSMRGASFLSGLADAIVVDIGGTTTDVGVLRAGLARQAGVAVQVGGVRTNFRMPDVYSVGLGGGSIVSADLQTVGPHSVGYRLLDDALVFGGSTLTATDIAVAAGVATLGDHGQVAHLPAEAVRACHTRLQRIVADAVERMRTTATPLPVVVVGGGSVLLGGMLLGQAVVVPQHFGVANAIGAAMGQVRGEADRVLQVGPALTREQALQQVRLEAEDAAVAAGADASTLALVDSEDVPLSYLGGGATRVRVKVVGELGTLPRRAGGTA